MDYDEAMWVIFGDFNEVRFSSERRNTEFLERRAQLFNNFIKDNALLDVTLGEESILESVIMAKNLAKRDIDFGPKPVRVFDEWLKHKDAYDIIKMAWSTKLRNWINDRETLAQKEKTRVEMLKQKARYKWALDGDENSKFFHPYIRQRQHKNNMHGVNAAGAWSSNPSLIKYEARKFFQSLFEKKDSETLKLNSWNGPKLEDQMITDLEANFSKKRF
ncbi:uncharacterized protein [Rutidosis leptorrhynchoides]|uniref:uncharacterized protein n=1 Tax=Rutidosis leptorrhynchoides TaxID=125765 RepID=UPI003A99A372